MVTPRFLSRLVLLAVVACALTLAPRRAAADDPPPDDPARVAFREGAQLIEQAEWARALAAFERSHAARPHDLTLYNIGVCQRYLGNYTLARQTLARALASNESSRAMPELFVSQARTYLDEMNAKLARLVVTLKPRTALVAVEGRPLTRAPGSEDAFIAGVAPTGAPTSVALDRFEIVVDPRPVVLTFSLEGHDTIELRREPKPGSREAVDVSMTEQPAQMRIGSNVPNAVVQVDGVDVGIAPLLVSRPPGVRLVTITSGGYTPYESKVTLKPGQLVPLDATLTPEKTPVTKRWWFWSGIAAAVLTAGVVTYFAVRPEPTRPEADPGKLGWVAEVK